MRVCGGEKEVKYVGRDGDSVDRVGRERWCEGRVSRRESVMRECECG